MQSARLVWLQLKSMNLPLFVAIVAALLFLVPQQTKEIYRSLAQVTVTTNWSKSSSYHDILVELSFGVIGIIGLSLALWFSARHAASVFQLEQAPPEKKQSGASFASRPWPLLWVPRLLLLFVPLCIGSAIWLSGVQPGFEEKVQDALTSVFQLQFIHEGLSEKFSAKLATNSAARTLLFSAYLRYFSLFILAIGVIIFLVVTCFDKPRLAHHLSKQKRSSSTYIASSATITIFVIIMWTGISFPVAAPQMLGAVFVMSLFLAVLLMVLLQLQSWSSLTGLPLVTFLTVGAVVFSALDWNDNHSIRTAHNAEGNARQIKRRDEGFSAAFEQWMGSREDAARYVGKKPYPIYIVAAQGGGIYAATHAASFLGELQDLCPGFGHHLFAISGVSGGSVGAAVFASLTQDVNWADKNTEEKFGCVTDKKAERATPFMDATSSIFRKDLWAPLSAALLFPDFLQRFIFFPVQSWDRGRALEFALEDAYDTGIRDSRFLPEHAVSKRPLAKSFLAHWNPEANSHTPALVINTTEVGTGKRRVIAPFSFAGNGLSFLPIWTTDNGDETAQDALDPTTSSAAGLSARFPWVTPAAHFYETASTRTTAGAKKKIRIVDGGYFENSGVVTALDLAKQIIRGFSQTQSKQTIEINLLIFTSSEFTTEGASGLGEVIDPIRTMINTQAARASLAIQEAVETLKHSADTTPQIETKVIRLELNGFGYPLPLGWRLSPVTRHLISFHNGSELFCKKGEGSGTPNADTAKTASCAKMNIYEQLR